MSLLELRQIGRSFGGVRALDDVDLDVDVLPSTDFPGGSTFGKPVPVSWMNRRSGVPASVLPAGHGVGTVTQLPFEHATAFGPKPPAAAGDA